MDKYSITKYIPLVCNVSVSIIYYLNRKHVKPSLTRRIVNTGHVSLHAFGLTKHVKITHTKSSLTDVNELLTHARNQIAI